MKTKLLLLIILFMINCSSISSYFKDRGNDLKDTVNASVGLSWFGGFGIIIGGYQIGCCISMESHLGMRNSKVSASQNFISPSDIFFINREQIEATESDTKVEKFRKKNVILGFKGSQNSELNNSQSHWAIGFSGGVILGVYFTINLAEVLDAMLGLVIIDILDDDFYRNSKGQIMDEEN